MDTPTAEDPSPPDSVPAEQRVAGLDRSSLRWAWLPLVVVVALAFGLPAIAASIAWDDPVAAGDVLLAGDGVTFTPVEGWGVESGIRATGAADAAVTGGDPVVTNGGFSFAVVTAGWDGDAASLLAQIQETTDALNDEGDFHVTGEPQSFTTAAGDTGLMARYLAPDSQGLLAALVIDGVGIEVTVTGPEAEANQSLGEDIAAMLVSIEHGESS